MYPLLLLTLLAATQPSTQAYGEPRQTLTTYFQAIRDNNVEAANACCTISDDNKSGALSLCSEMFIVPRRLAQLSLSKFGKLPDCWKPYEHLAISNDQLDKTIKSVRSAEVAIADNHATLAPSKDEPFDPVFAESIPFKKIGQTWKIDVNTYADLRDDPAAAIAPGTWGFAFLAQVRIMKDLTTELEAGQIKNVNDLDARLRTKIQVLRHEFERATSTKPAD